MVSSSPRSPSLAPSVPGLVRVKSLVRSNSMYQTMANRMQKQKCLEDVLVHPPHERSPTLSLESLMSVGLGSGPHGETISYIVCANYSTRQVVASRRCLEKGVLPCPRCRLVTYCSERCQKQHWPRHSAICAHPYLEENWEPGWITQNRPPSFACSSNSFSPSSFIFPTFDVLRVSVNEGEDALHRNLKLCFAACGDIRNLVSTVNNLPKNYQGRLDVLMNHSDPIITNRNLVILYALLNPEPSIDEAAELAVHLMYSSALTAPGAAYLQRCLDKIYGTQFGSGSIDISFQVSLATRGMGKIQSLQTIAGVKRAAEMFNSTYLLSLADNSRRRIFDAPENADSWDRFLSRLRPSHRMAFKRLRETGVLAPFSLNTANFMHPNRLVFSAQGEWLGNSDFNPLRGWDATAVQETGTRSGIDAADLFGCLFFHLKHQCREFASRVKNLDINIFLTQFDPRILSKGVFSGGVTSTFEGACFDRVDTSDMMDEIGVRECLADWGPTLNRANPFASLLMHSHSWYHNYPYAVAKCNPHAALAIFMHKCIKVPGLRTRLETVFTQGMRSPALLRLLDSLDAFYDHDDIFREFLDDQNAESAAAPFGFQLRPQHRIHPKRFGVPLTASDHQLPVADISRNEFYDLASLCEIDFSARFLEFGWEGASVMW